MSVVKSTQETGLPCQAMDIGEVYQEAVIQDALSTGTWSHNHFPFLCTKNVVDYVVFNPHFIWRIEKHYKGTVRCFCQECSCHQTVKGSDADINTGFSKQFK